VQTDDEFLAAATQRGTTTFHPGCTCRMGPADSSWAVVDDQLRVHGLQNLRVVDASIMPRMISANLNASTLMIADKASDLIRRKEAAGGGGLSSSYGNSCPGRDAARSSSRSAARRTGTPALQRTASQELRAALRPGHEKSVGHRSRTCECIPIPVPQNSLSFLASCFDEGALSRGDPSADRAKAGRTGAPGTVDGLVAGGSAGRRCALPWARAVALPREVGSPTRLKGAIGALAPPTAPSPRAVREGLANLGRNAPRERERLAV